MLLRRAKRAIPFDWVARSARALVKMSICAKKKPSDFHLGPNIPGGVRGQSPPPLDQSGRRTGKPCGVVR